MSRRVHIDANTQTIVFNGPQSLCEAKEGATLAAAFGRRAFEACPRRMKFTGKGYKIRKIKRSRTYKLSFGRSHRTAIIIGGVASKRYNKHNVMLLSNDYKVTGAVAAKMVMVRKANPYTKRGLRRARQFLIKRPGKKTTY